MTEYNFISENLSSLKSALKELQIHPGDAKTRFKDVFSEDSHYIHLLDRLGKYYGYTLSVVGDLDEDPYYEPQDPDYDPQMWIDHVNQLYVDLIRQLVNIKEKMEDRSERLNYY